MHKYNIQQKTKFFLKTCYTTFYKNSASTLKINIYKSNLYF